MKHVAQCYWASIIITFITNVTETFKLIAILILNFGNHLQL